MATTTTRAGLTKPDNSENYSVSVVNNNSDRIDQLLGCTPCTTGTRPATPIQGQTIFETDTNLVHVSNGTPPLSGSWVQVGGLTASRGVVGGRRVTGTNNLTPAATGTVEVAPTSMNSGSVALQANRLYRVTARYACTGTAANDVHMLRIKVGATAGTGGTTIREQPHTTWSTTPTYTYDVVAEYETGSAETRVFTLTAQRTSGSGNLQFKGGGSGSTNPVGVWVVDVGAASKLTTTAS